MLPSRFLAQLAVSFVLALRANAESHTFLFVNQCGFGTPALVYDGNNILTSDTYTSPAPWSGIAYLQTGYCSANGEHCTLLETTLINPTCSGCGSSTDLSLIPPHNYSVETSFAYYGGCDGQGMTCDNPECTAEAFFTPTDYWAQVACQTPDVNLMVAFCTNASELVLGGYLGGGSPSTNPSSVPPTSGGSSPTSPLPAPSGTPISGSSTPGPMTPPLTPTLSTTPTPSAAPTNISDPCEETTPTPTPSPVPQDTNVSDPGCEETGTPTPTSTPTNVSDPGNVPTSPTTSPTSSPPPSPPPTSTPTPSPSPTQTTPPDCQLHPTGLSSSPPISGSKPAVTPSLAPSFTPSSVPSFTPSLAPSSTPSGNTTTPGSKRRRHRRTANHGQI